MNFADLLNTFHDELAASLAPMPEWLTAFAARNEDPAAVQEAAAALTDCLQRAGETAALLGLEGLAAFFAARAQGTLYIALEADLERIMHEADWPPLALAYAHAPTPDNALPLAEWLLTHCMADEQTDAILGLLAQDVQAPEGLVVNRERQFYAPGDLSLELPLDVDGNVYDAFVQDAPEQAAQASALLMQYFGASDMQALNGARRIVHTFKGTAHLIGISGIGRFAHSLEDLLDRLAEKPAEQQIPVALQHLCVEAADGLESLVEAHLARRNAPPGTLDLLQRIADWDYALAGADWASAAAVYDALERPLFAEELGDATDESAATPLPRAATADDENRPTVRIAVDTVDAMLRASNQLAIQIAQLKDQLVVMTLRNQQLSAEHADAQRSVQALQLAVDTHSMRQAAQGGTDVDPLELDRYNELSSLARMTAESVDDARAVGQGLAQWIGQTDAVLAEQLRLQKQIQTMVLDTRMVTAGALAPRLARSVRQTARAAGKEVAFQFHGEQVVLDADVLDALAPPLIHVLRNAVDHGIEHAQLRDAAGKTAAGLVSVRFARVGARVELTVTDDGAGYDFAAIREKALERGLISADDELDHDALAQITLLPGFSTAERVTETSGRGVGMDVVAESVRKLNGHLHITSLAGAGTQIQIRVPASLAMMHLLIVQTAAGRFAIPSSSIGQALAPGMAQIAIDGTRTTLTAADKTYSAHLLAERLGVTPSASAQQCAWLLLEQDNKPVAVGVETLLSARESIVRKPGRMTGHVGLLGATLDISGAVLPVLDLAGILRHSPGAALGLSGQLARAPQRLGVLVVDDSVSVRRGLAQLLEDAGYAVYQARDGLDALTQINRHAVNLVLTDLEMPEMNGIDLTRNLRQRADAAHVPVVMITSRSTDKHRSMAQAAGVNHYLVKPYTDQALLDLASQLTRVDRPSEALAA